MSQTGKYISHFKAHVQQLNNKNVINTERRKIPRKYNCGKLYVQKKLKSCVSITVRVQIGPINK